MRYDPREQQARTRAAVERELDRRDARYTPEDERREALKAEDRMIAQQTGERIEGCGFVPSREPDPVRVRYLARRKAEQAAALAEQDRKLAAGVGPFPKRAL